MLEQLKKHRFYFIPTLIFILGGTILQLILHKGEMVMWFDGFSPSFKVVFSYITKLAEFAGGGIIAVLIFLKGSRKDMVVYVLAAFSALVVSQSLKMMVFPHNDRPSKVLELKEIEGVTRHTHLSFPSGHTTAAFAMFGALALVYRKRWQQIACALVALMVGVSRMVLGQHYLEDVIAGTALGMLLLSVFAYLGDRYLDREALNKRLIKTND